MEEKDIEETEVKVGIPNLLQLSRKKIKVRSHRRKRSHVRAHRRRNPRKRKYSG